MVLTIITTITERRSVMRYLLCFLALCGLSFLPRPATAADPNPTLAVGIFVGRSITACTLTSQAPMKLEDAAGRPVADLPAGAQLHAEVKDGEAAISCSQPRGSGHDARYVVSSSSPIRVELEGVKARLYRNAIEISAQRGRLMLVNRIALEDYLRGVLPSEIPASFEPEALRAQAIAARTFATKATGRHTGSGYDLCDGLHCQVYLGAGAEKQRTDDAVRATAGLIVTYGHQPIDAVYHDCCGGRTAGNETAWQGADPLPYLRPVPDSNGSAAFCDHSPRSVWTRQIPQAKLATALASLKVAAPISAIEAGACDENGRPREYTIRGAGGDVVIRAGVLRTAANRVLGADAIPSADFTAAPNGDSFVFAGRGSGHGVGLCQWGANTMAKAGNTAAQILAHYYSGTAVEPLTGQLTAAISRQPRG